MAKKRRRERQREATQAPEPSEEPKRLERARPHAIRLTRKDVDAIVQRVKDYARQDMEDRSEETDRIVQRIAKKYMVTSGRSSRWHGGSDFAPSDMAAACYQMQDTLVNAGLSTFPICEAESDHPERKEAARRVSLLQHHQMFREQDGERLIDELFGDLMDYGHYRGGVEWVHEEREVTFVRELGKVDVKVSLRQHFERLMRENLSLSQMVPTDGEGWEWRARASSGATMRVRFYVDEGEVSAELRGKVTVMRAPKLTRYSHENVLHPFWCENLQPPGPSNPNGATHVILVDTPTIREVKALIQSGEYDRITASEIAEHVQRSVTGPDRETFLSIEDEMDAMRGFDAIVRSRAPDVYAHGTMVRYRCYDTWERDGEDIDVIWTVLPEVGLLCRAVPLGEDCPILPPVRPIFEGVMLRRPGRCTGISMLEIMESSHDYKKRIIDALMDGADLEMRPWFSYVETSSTKPEDYIIGPGFGLPVRNQGDIQPQTFQMNGSNGLNLLSLLENDKQEVTMLGDLQAGRIPAGKSAALRNKGTVQSLLAQGEARPQRLLARAFSGIRQAMQMMWGLNKAYLPQDKAWRMIGAPEPGEELIELQRGDLTGEMDFSFVATIFNASKQAQQEGLSEAVQLFLNPLAFELKWIDSVGGFRLAREYMRARGVDMKRYTDGPSPEAQQERISAAAAFYLILAGIPPDGVPAEEPEDHVTRLGELMKQPTAGGAPIGQTLGAAQIQALQGWIAKVREFQAQREAALRQQAAARQLVSQRQQTSAGAGPGAPPAPGPSRVAPNDVTNESLPASGTPQ